MLQHVGVNVATCLLQLQLKSFLAARPEPRNPQPATLEPQGETRTWKPSTDKQPLLKDQGAIKQQASSSLCALRSSQASLRFPAMALALS